MKSYIILTKKRLFIIIAFLICFGFISFEIYAVNNADKNAKTNTDRLAFVKELGYTVICNDPSQKVVIIPEIFNDVYNNYNALQRTAGYDLLIYKGCEATIYTYSINAPEGYDGMCVVNMIVYKDRVIGGDVSSSAIDGFMFPLKQVTN